MATSKTQRGLNDGSAIYFLIKPFKILWTTGILCLSFVAIGATSLMYFCTKDSLSALLRAHEEIRITNNGLEQGLGYWIFKFFSWIAFDLTQIRLALNSNPVLGTAMYGFKRFLMQQYEGLMMFNMALQIISYRVGILLAYTFTLLLVVLIVATFDGWMERRVRTLCLGRESSTMYHQAKFFRTGAIVSSVMVFLSWPAYLEPVWLVVFSVVFAVFVRTQAKYYKKYI